MLPFKQISEEILYSSSAITKVRGSDIEFLKRKSLKNIKKRVRLCSHPGIDDALHEMIIVHHKGNYIPPHKHPGKSESFHIVEGCLMVVVFDDNGDIHDVIEMSERKVMEGLFYYRLSKSLFHTVIPCSSIVVFHETTNGPFRRQDMIFAKWAPGENDPEEQQLAYINDLKVKIEEFNSRNSPV